MAGYLFDQLANKVIMKKDIFTRSWIIETSIGVCSEYDFGVLTLRSLYYQLVSKGMTNSMRHYKRVVAAMIQARWDGVIEFEQFSDHDRSVLGETFFETISLKSKIEVAEDQIKAWMESMSRSRWENQHFVPEVWIEKKALQGVFNPICINRGVALAPCKGYPSLTFLNEAKGRFEEVISNNRTPIILYFGDYDATGEDIPRSIEDNLTRLGVYVKVKRISLLESQVIEMKLPHAPTKSTDSRAKNWDGFGQVELDAVKPEILKVMCEDAIDYYFDDDLFEVQKIKLKEEKKEYRRHLKEFVKKI